MYPHREITENIIAAAIEVHRQLGPAYHESIYQRALAVEFGLQQIGYEREKPIEIAYKGQSVGFYRLDFFVEGQIVLELKAVDALSDIHLSQMLSYLSATGKQVGLIINFAQSRLVDGIKRVIL